MRAYDGAPTADDPAGRAAAWSAAAVDGHWRDQLASWPISLAVDGVRFCHGSPRDEDEILTTATPDPVFASVLADVSEPLVVGGHTHRQFVRPVRDGLRYANAGSIGLPYEGRRGAFWMLVDGGEPEMRRTDYDFDAALVEMRASGFAALDDHFKESLITPADADGVSAFFEGRDERRSRRAPVGPSSGPGYRQGSVSGRSIMLPSSLPAWSRARTTKYAAPCDGRPGVWKLLTPGFVVHVGLRKSSPPGVVDM